MMNQIQQEINENSPFVSDLKPTSEYADKWKDNKFFDSLVDLSTQYPQLREMRRDGNCFYRAYLWQMWEHYLENLTDPTVKADFDRVGEVIKDSKQDLMTQGYDEIAIEDFYNCFHDEFK